MVEKGGVMAAIFETFEKSAKNNTLRPAIAFLKNGEKVHWTYRELLDRANRCAAVLRKLGLKQGDHVALISANDPNWSVVDLAVNKLGIVLVPIHTVLTVDQIAKVLDQSRSKMLVLGPGVEDKTAALLGKLPPCTDSVLFFEKSLKKGELPKGKQAHFLDELMKQAQPLPASDAPKVKGEDLSTIIFTSGTTGEMKGVLLTHRGLTDSTIFGNEPVEASPEDIVLSVLPLSHAFERNAGLFGPLFLGAQINYGRGLPQLVEDIQVFRPTRINAVPRLLEKIRAGVMDNLKKRSEGLYNVFLKVLEQSTQLHKKKSERSAAALLHLPADRIGELLFYKKIRQKFGGRLRRIICGGAPIDPEVVEFFESIGIEVLQGYGLTEVSPTVSVNPRRRNKIGSVGLPLRCVEVKLGDDDEILVKGSTLMRGYDSEQATREAIDKEGWFHTGDQGYIDEDGYLYIKGRIKEMLVTSYGKNVIPSVVEQALEKSPWFLQSAVFGHGKAYLVALLVLNQEIVRREFSAPEYAALAWPELCRHPKVLQRAKEELARVQQELASYEQVKKFEIVPEEFSQDNDMLTPTLKLKRRKILERYEPLVAAMYKEPG